MKSADADIDADAVENPTAPTFPVTIMQFLKAIKVIVLALIELVTFIDKFNLVLNSY